MTTAKLISMLALYLKPFDKIALWSMVTPKPKQRKLKSRIAFNPNPLAFPVRETYYEDEDVKK